MKRLALSSTIVLALAGLTVDAPAQPFYSQQAEPTKKKEEKKAPTKRQEEAQKTSKQVGQPTPNVSEKQQQKSTVRGAAVSKGSAQKQAPKATSAKIAAPAQKAAQLAPAKLQAKENESFTGVRYVNLNKKDPFFNPLLARKRAEIVDEEEGRGAPPPGIAGMYVAQVALIGVSQRGGSNTAVFRGTDKRAYFLHTGDRVYDGYLKSISGDSVVLVRETKFKSGRQVTQDVVKRLREP